MPARVETIRRLFGSGATSGYALDAREYKRGGNPKNPGQFSSGGGASSGAKAVPRKDTSAQAHAAAKAKVAENATKPKKAPKPAVKPKKPRESTAKWAESMAAKPSRRRNGEESPVAAPKTAEGITVEPSSTEKTPKAAPDIFHSELKKINNHASLTSKIFSSYLAKELGGKAGSSLPATIKNLRKAGHSDDHILKTAKAIAEEHTRRR
jgi:hypothetical protein